MIWTVHECQCDGSIIMPSWYFYFSSIIGFCVKWALQVEHIMLLSLFILFDFSAILSISGHFNGHQKFCSTSLSYVIAIKRDLGAESFICFPDKALSESQWLKILMLKLLMWNFSNGNQWALEEVWDFQVVNAERVRMIEWGWSGQERAAAMQDRRPSGE